MTELPLKLQLGSGPLPSQGNTKQPLGLLLNFGAPTFRDGLKRIVNGHSNFASSRLRVHQIPPVR